MNSPQHLQVLERVTKICRAKLDSVRPYVQVHGGSKVVLVPDYLFETDYKPTVNTIYNYAHPLSYFLLYFLSCVHKTLCIAIVEIRRQFEMFESSAKTPFGVKIHGLCC